jgi:hypothetical protein
MAADDCPALRLLFNFIVFLLRTDFLKTNSHQKLTHPINQELRPLIALL